MSQEYSNSNENSGLKRKILSPKLDVVFQALFGEVGSEKITKRFLENILQEKIQKIDLSKNIVLRRERENEKLGVLDIIAKINDTEHCNIEMQLVDTKEIRERMLYYWSRIYARQLKKGQEYKELEKTIVILITNFEIGGLENLKYHTEWKIIDRETRKVILTDKLELHIIMLPKVREEEQGELIDWLLFLENPKSERVKEKMKENEELKEAVEKLEGMSQDEYMQRIADLREKAILDYNSGMSSAMRKGIEDGLRRGIKQGVEQGIKQGVEQGIKQGVEQGIKQGVEQGIKQGVEQGIKQGVEQGIKQGVEQGIKQGKKEGKKETAKKMLEEKIPIEVIIKVTGLSKEEILSE